MLQGFREEKEEWSQKELPGKTQVVIWKITVTGEEVGRGPPWREANLSKGLGVFMRRVCSWSLSFFSFPLIWYQFLVPSNMGMCSSEAQPTLLPVTCGQDLICIGFQVGESSSLKKGKRSKVRHKDLKSTVNQGDPSLFLPSLYEKQPGYKQ